MSYVNMVLVSTIVMLYLHLDITNIHLKAAESRIVVLEKANRELTTSIDNCVLLKDLK